MACLFYYVAIGNILISQSLSFFLSKQSDNSSNVIVHKW